MTRPILRTLAMLLLAGLAAAGVAHAEPVSLADWQGPPPRFVTEDVAFMLSSVKVSILHRRKQGLPRADGARLTIEGILQLPDPRGVPSHLATIHLEELTDESGADLLQSAALAPVTEAPPFARQGGRRSLVSTPARCRALDENGRSLPWTGQPTTPSLGNLRDGIMSKHWLVETNRLTASAVRVRFVTGVREIALPFDFRDVAIAPDPDALPPEGPPVLARRLHFGQDGIRGHLSGLRSTQEVEFAAGPRRDLTIRRGMITAAIAMELPETDSWLSRAKAVVTHAATAAPLELLPAGPGESFPRWWNESGTVDLETTATHAHGPPSRIDRLDGVVRLRRARVLQLDVPLDAAGPFPPQGGVTGAVISVDDRRTVVEIVTARTVRAPAEPALLPSLIEMKVLDANREPIERAERRMITDTFGDRLITRFEIARGGDPVPVFARFECITEAQDIEIPFTFADLPLARRDP